MIILSSEKESEAGEDRYVYKYQSAESLVREVMTYCQESPPTELELGYKKKLHNCRITQDAAQNRQKLYISAAEHAKIMQRKETD